MIELPRLAGQAAVYVAIAAFIGYFASRPAYTPFPPCMAQIKLSFAHGAQRKEACRRLTAEEIAKLPPKERRPSDCKRERLPVRIQLSVDGQALYDAELLPTGLARDGPSRAYEKFIVSAGHHELTARLRDSDRADGFDYQRTLTVDLAAGQNLAVDFKADAGGFVLR